MGVFFVARQAENSPSKLFARKRRMLEGRHAAVQVDEDVIGTFSVRDRFRDLERLLGCKTIENEILKEALDVARPQTFVPAGGGSRFRRSSHAARGSIS